MNRSFVCCVLWCVCAARDSSLVLFVLLVCLGAQSSFITVELASLRRTQESRQIEQIFCLMLCRKKAKTIFENISAEENVSEFAAIVKNSM